MTLPERLRRWAEITDVPGRAERLRALADIYEAHDVDDEEAELATTRSSEEQGE